MITFGILALLTLVVLVFWTVVRRRRREATKRQPGIPLFTVPVSSLVPFARPVPESTAAAPPVPASFDPSRATSRSPATARDSQFPMGSATIKTRDGAVSTLARSPRPDPLPSIDDEILGDPVEGASIRYWRVADGTLQFLPGRLAIAAGRDAGHEIRFVRTAGPDGTCITFGRAEGAPYRHVQLREPTVSRAHARMSLEASGAPSNGSNGNWRLENLSSTNPVVVNGRALGGHGGATSSVILSDGDRIEMGEVAFVFHER